MSNNNQLPDPEAPVTNLAAHATSTKPSPQATSTIDASRRNNDNDQVANIKQTTVITAAISTVDALATCRD